MIEVSKEDQEDEEQAALNKNRMENLENKIQ